MYRSFVICKIKNTLCNMNDNDSASWSVIKQDCINDQLIICISLGCSNQITLDILIGTDVIFNA